MTASTWPKHVRVNAINGSGFGKVVSYAIHQWPTLIRYVADAAFSLDNGMSERAIRRLALGRYNWLFIGGDTGLSSAGVLLSLCASAKQHKLNPWHYLRDVLSQLPIAGTNLDSLMPDHWRPAA